MVKCTARLTEALNTYLKEKGSSDDYKSNTEFIIECLEDYRHSEDLFKPIELMCGVYPISFTFNLEDEIYDDVMKGVAEGAINDLSKYTRCALGYHMAIDYLKESGFPLGELLEAIKAPSVDDETFVRFDLWSSGKGLRITISTDYITKKILEDLYYSAVEELNERAAQEQEEVQA